MLSRGIVGSCLESRSMSSQSAPPARPQAQHAHMLSPAPRPVRDWWTVALAVFLLLSLAGLGVALFWLYSSAWIMPGVETMGISLGGMSRQAAVDLLDSAWEGRVVVLEDGDQRRTVHAVQLGLTLNAGATADAALAVGPMPVRLRALFHDPMPVRIAPTVRVADVVARRYLQQQSPHMAVPPSDAMLQIVEGQVVVVPAAPGRALDVEATMAWLQAHPVQVVEEGRLGLAFLKVPPVDTGLDSLVKEADERLSNTLSVRVYDPIADESLWWTAPPAVWGDWMTLDIALGPPSSLAWTLDVAQVRAFLSAHADALSPDRFVDLEDAAGVVEAAMSSQQWNVSLRAYHHPQQHVVQLGETIASIGRDYGFPYPWLEQANPGVEALHPGQVVNIPSPDVLLPLPVVSHKRIVISISQQQMWAYEWEALQWAWAVSTGIESSPTSPGVFQIQSHDTNAYAASWDLWMPYFIGIYRPVPTSSFMNGFHGFPTRDGSNLLWTANLGHPVTYGCILLSTYNASVLYDWAEAGVVVEIRR
jgi:lipoprotein-anchoring transpeptidase ErfK/SrfK